MGYRIKLDIIADMLLVARPGAKKTHIMYKANLSYNLLTRYLEQIRKASLISFERKQGLYFLTSKGQRFLEVYEEYSRRNRNIEKRRDDVNHKRKVLEGLCSRGICEKT
jgi:predicted transcriptional regulator